MPNHHRVLMLPPLLALALPLAAQSASSPTFFLVAGEAGSGGSCQSFLHHLTGTSSAGAPAARAVSPSYVLLGGFPAAIEAPAVGTPWLCGVDPALAPLLGGTPLVLHGTELNLGPAPAITVGGQAAATGARTNATIQTVLPPQPQPGYQPVVVQGPFGSSTLPRGIGVLPLLDLPVAHQANVPFALRYIGAQGDFVVIGLASATSPFTLPFPPFHHGLQLDLSSLLVLPMQPVTSPDGILSLALPATPSASIFFQAFVLTQNPGWSPGSFTNIVRL